MIRQQRELLKQTFAARQLPQLPSGRPQRLADSQQQLLTATQEFTAGLQQRAGEVPPLNAAIASMQAAVDALRGGLLTLGQGHEESALASLIAARQNLREILKMSDSSQASECRSFDRQQQQKLRTPEQQRDAEDKQAQEQLAQACQQLEQLAQQQEQWSQQACPSPSSSGSRGTQTSPPDAARQQELAQEQQAAIQQVDQIAQDLRSSQRSGQLAEPRLDGAADQMQQALDELGAERHRQASEAAGEAAQRLRELAEHLQALNQPDFAQQLARTGSVARDLADRQQQLARAMRPSGGPASQQQQAHDGTTEWQEAEQSAATPAESGPAAGGTSPAGQQRGLARRAEELDELTARLAAAALDQQPEIQRMVNEARQANPVGEIAELMQAAAADLEARREAAAAQTAELAAQGLNQLAEDLRKAHQRYTQPDMEQLLAAEQAAAELLQKLLDSRGEGERALARSQLEELQRVLAPLAASDRRVAEAVDALQPGSSSSETDQADSQRNGDGTYERTGESRPAGEPRLNRSDQALVSGLRQVTNVLQTMIQETILDRALAEPDDAVPPGYERMVEEYYRALSEDLRD